MKFSTLSDTVICFLSFNLRWISKCRHFLNSKHKLRKKFFHPCNKKRPRLRSTAAGAFAVVHCTRYNNTAAAPL